MGILSAMNKSVGGLNAQSFALENLSGNIANAQTTAFKRTDTSFQDLVQSGTSRVSMMSAGNVRAMARSTIGIQGAIEASAVETFMGVKGAGFFVAKQRVGEVDGASIFAPGNVYTRRGDFQLDKEGHLVNQAGYYLAGLAIDPATGNPIGDTPDTIKITKGLIPAEQSTQISYRLNLPSRPLTTYNRDTEDDDTGLWAADANRAGPPADGIVDKDGSTEFLANSIAGGAVTVYDATGNQHNVQLRWAKTSDTPASWELYYQTDADPAAGTDPAWVRINPDPTITPPATTPDDTTFSFDAAGKLTDTFNSIDLSGDNQLTIEGVDIEPISLDFGSSDGITQYADSAGMANVRQITQDGLPAGNFQDVTITDGGRVIANYSNGKSVDLYQIPLVEFSGETSLRPMDGGAYAETKESGPPINNVSGQIIGAALEGSNVDIGEEFTKLIVTQQAFSANSRVISAADQMMTDIINIIR